MTCVLSMSPVYTKTFNEECTQLQNKVYDNLGNFKWINTQNTQSGLTDFHGNSAFCRLSRLEHSNGINGCTKRDHIADNNKEKTCDILKTVYDSVTNSECHSSTNGMCNKIEPDYVRISNNSVKRKAVVTEFDEVYIPSKRVSPFLNTPKERKDERKKLLKISIKKLKQLDDPEAFLRKTVLVNNTRKRLQSEFREEILRNETHESNRRKSFSSGYGVFNLKCMSQCYLFDDLYVCGVNEKITDDMTDTLINNVFYDDPKARISESVINEKVDADSKEMDIADVDFGILSSLQLSKDAPDQNSSEKSNNVTACIKDCSIPTRFSDKISMRETIADRCDDIEAVCMCNVNSNTEKSTNIWHSTCQCMTVNEGNKEVIKLASSGLEQSGLNQSQSDRNMNSNQIL